MLGLQLYELGLADSEVLDPGGAIVRALMTAYEDMGDAIAQQYGGSDANKKVGDVRWSFVATCPQIQCVRALQRVIDRRSQVMNTPRECGRATSLRQALHCLLQVAQPRQHRRTRFRCLAVLRRRRRLCFRQAGCRG